MQTSSKTSQTEKPQGSGTTAKNLTPGAWMRQLIAEGIRNPDKMPVGAIRRVTQPQKA